MAGRGGMRTPGGMGGMGGLGGMDPSQASAMMKRFGIDVRDIPDVEEVVVRTATADYVFRRASVSVMKAQGVETWQVSGNPTKVPKGQAAPPSSAPAQEEDADGDDGEAPIGGGQDVAYEVTADDLELVRAQTGASEAAARKALVDTKGDLAEAILRLKPA